MAREPLILSIAVKRIRSSPSSRASMREPILRDELARRLTMTTTKQTELLGGTPTALRPTATAVGVAMTAVLLVVLPLFVYYLWICLEFNHGHLIAPSAALFKY